MRYSLSDNTWNDEELEAIQEVIDSGRFTMGPKTKEFEEKFASYFGSKYAVMVNSGSSANLLAIAALYYSGKLSRGDEVIVPAVSWSTTYYPLYQYGLKLKIVDIDRDTLNIDINLIEEAITDKTKAIFAVNLLGNPNDFDKLNDICDEHGLILIEDNCEALGAKYKSKYCGTFGILGTFSMFYSHHICTMEGGMIVTDNKELYHYLISLRSHGWTRDLPEDSNIFTKSKDPFYDSFNFILPGYNLRPLEIEAAIGLVQIDKINKIIENRRYNASIFKELFENNKNYKVQKELGESSWFGFAIILENKGIRTELINKLVKNGIEVRPIVAGDFTKNPVIKYMDYEVHDKLTNAEYINDNAFFVGNHSEKILEKIHNLLRVLEL